MSQRIQPAAIAALLTFLIGLPIFGVNLRTEGIKLVVEPVPASTWWIILGACVLVFISQLLQKEVAKGQSGLAALLPKKNILDLLPGGRVQQIFLIALVLALFTWPFFGSRGAVDLATLVLIYVMLGLGLNIVVGLAGLLDLGYVGFYAVGAYTYGLLHVYFDMGFWLALPIAGIMAAIFGFLLGFPVLRLRGDYLAIVTLGFGEIIRILLNNLTHITGGPNGIGGIPKPTFFGLEFNRKVKDGGFDTFHNFFGFDYASVSKVIFLYILALILVLLCIWVINRLLRMPIGRAWEALREDEIACRSLGLSPTAIKLSAFTIGATTAGFAGAFFAAKQGFISPESFVFMESAIILAIVVLGGLGSQIGVILAAIVIIVVPELAREMADYRMLMFGLIMVLMMRWRPQGFLPMKRPHIELKDTGAKS